MNVAEKRKMIISGRRRLKGIHLSFNTTIESDEQKGFSPIYFHYYFTYEYLNLLNRSLRRNKVIIWHNRSCLA